jgi:hypothetical protein
VEFSAYCLPADLAVAVGVIDKQLPVPTGASQTGYAVVRAASCQHDDGPTHTAPLGAEGGAPHSGASELHGAQALRAKTFKHQPAAAWATLQTPGKVTQAVNKHPLDATVPSIQYDCNAAHAPPKLGGHWRCTPPAPAAPSFDTPTDSSSDAVSSPAAAPAAAVAEEKVPSAASPAGESEFARSAGTTMQRVVVLRWSNAYSWVKSKTIARRVRVWSAQAASKAVAMEPLWRAAHEANRAKEVPRGLAAASVAVGAAEGC